MLVVDCGFAEAFNVTNGVATLRDLLMELLDPVKITLHELRDLANL